MKTSLVWVPGLESKLVNYSLLSTEINFDFSYRQTEERQERPVGGKQEPVMKEIKY